MASFLNTCKIPGSPKPRVIVVTSDPLRAEILMNLSLALFPECEISAFHFAREVLQINSGTPVSLGIFGVQTHDIDGLDYIPHLLATVDIKRALCVTARTDLRTLALLESFGLDAIVGSHTTNSREIATAIREVASGRRFVSSALVGRMKLSRLWSREFPLSVREQLVLSILGEGVDDQLAAARLSLSPTAIRGYRGRIMQKLGLHHKGELVRYALTHLFTRITAAGVFLHPGFDRALDESAFASRNADQTTSNANNAA